MVHPRPCLLLLPLVGLVLAGCATPAERHDVPDASWPVLQVETTAVEPWEFQGFLRIAWDGPIFAIDSEVEPDLPRYLVRDGQSVYTSRQGIGWTRWDLDDAILDGALSNRLVLWDLRGLVGHPDLSTKVEDEDGSTVLRTQGSLRHARAALPLWANVTIQNGRVVHAEVASPRGRESPFAFVPSAEGLSFAPRVPPTSRTEGEIQELDAAARRAHVDVILLIQDYAERRGGQLPERVDAETLGLDMTLSGKTWPKNPYTDAPLGEGHASGAFEWKRCTARTGVYVGHGWDLSVVGESFGGNCALG